MRNRLIYICSPLRGDIEKNIQKAQGYCREAVDLWPDVIPIAPHVYCTQFLDDTIPQERDRETLFEVNALLPRFEYGREYDQESFLVSMQACFAPSDEREDVTKVASNIVSTQEATFSDDGISQQVVMKTGVTKKENAIIPNPVRLIPYRTFLEVEQPESEFVFRITEGRGGVPFFKLVAADGGRWEAVAVDNVKSYLVEALADIPNREQLTIIA